MRNAILFAIALLLGGNSFAQFTRVKRVDVNPFVTALLKAQYANTPVASAEKTTASKQRLIAQSEYGVTGEIMDSFSVKYSGERGSKFNAELMNFGQWIGPGFQWYNGMIFGFYGDGRLANKNMGPDILGDTLRQYSGLPTPPYAYGHFADQYHSYDGNNNMLNEYWEADPVVGGTREFVLRYNGLNNIARLWVVAEGGDTLATALFLYNSANQMVVDSICGYDAPTSSYHPLLKYTHEYDALGNMIQGKSYGWSGSAWAHQKDYDMSYYTGTNQLKACTIGDAGGIDTYDTFGYTPGITYSTYHKQMMFGIPGGTQVYEQIRHVGPSGLPDTMRSYDHSLGNLYLYAYTYNSYNNPVCMVEYDSNASSTFTQAQITYYYYQLYNATGISSVVPANGAMTLYPNPASNTLYLTRKDFAANMPETVRIYNQWGAVVKRETLYRTRGTEELSLAELVPGMYTIYVESDGTAETRQIIKL